MPDADLYEIQFTDGPGASWSSGIKVKGNLVRKRVRPGLTYEVRLRALVDGRWSLFSQPSVPLSPAVLADCWRQGLGDQLTNSKGETVPTETIAGSLVCLFAAA